jgi:hypothetical protein
MNLLFERLRLQGHFRNLIDTHGRDAALDIIETALKKEIDRETPATRLHTKIQQKSPDPV